MAGKFYVVWRGHQPGIYTSWSHCKEQIHKFKGARYKSFPSLNEAQAAFGQGAIVPFKKATQKQTETKAEKSASLSQELILSMPHTYKIFTDGACELTEAGSGMAVYVKNEFQEMWYGSYDCDGTNNTAELRALLQGLILAKMRSSLGDSVVIFSDSTYAIGCVTQWSKGWEKRGWKKRNGEIANLELVKQLYAIYQELKGSVDILHVRAHAGIEGNELADRMSMLAIESQEVNFSLYREFESLEEVLSLPRG
ncbi:ribonuclease H1 domain-containing protein [Vibrio alfacsensis]|uniref:ribonuclease H1 domain-containing protein n=1 Tax=Vibrio TaxID=662 RepID=UPI0040683FC3